MPGIYTRTADGLVPAIGAAGEDGADGVGVPAGGAAGQVLAKASATDHDTEWVDVAAAEDYLTQAEADELYEPLATLTPATFVGATSGGNGLAPDAFSCPLPPHSSGDLVIGWSDAETGVVPLPSGYSQLTAVATTRSFWKLTADNTTTFTHGAGGRWATAVWAAYRGTSYANLIAAVTGSTTAGFTDTDMCKVLYLVEHTGNTVAASVTGATLRVQFKRDNANSNVAIYEDDVANGTVPARTFGSAVRINTVALYPVDAQVFTSAEKTKLTGIATGATANAADAALRDRTTHTGTQAISTVTDLQTALDAKVTATGTATKLHGPITQAAYDALTPDPDTLYVIVG